MAEGEGGAQGTQGTEGSTGQVLFQDYRDQLPVDLRANEAFTNQDKTPVHKTFGDLGKAHIEILGKAKDLEGKLSKINETHIPKLPENPTPEQIVIFRQALGVPDKPEGYEFPKREGEDNDPKMVSWAQNLFHKHNIPKNVAFDIAGQWNEFLTGVEQEEDRLIQEEITGAEKKFRGEFKSDDEFKAALELNKRYYKKMMGTDIPPFMDAYSITKFIYEHAKKYGEASSPPGSQTRGAGDQKPRMIYDRTPQHQKR